MSVMVVFPSYGFWGQPLARAMTMPTSSFNLQILIAITIQMTKLNIIVLLIAWQMVH